MVGWLTSQPNNLHISINVQIIHVSDTHDWYMSIHRFSRYDVLFRRLQRAEYLFSNRIRIKLQKSNHVITELVFSNEQALYMLLLSKFTVSFLMSSLHFLNVVSLTHPGGRELILKSSWAMIYMHACNDECQFLIMLNNLVDQF